MSVSAVPGDQTPMTNDQEPMTKHATRLQHQCLSAVPVRRGRRPDRRVRLRGSRAAGRRAPRLAGRAAGRARSGRSSQAMERNGLSFSNVNAFMMNAVNDYRQPYWYPSFIEPDPHYRRVRIDHTRRALSLCAELGAPHITTEPGGPLAPGQTRQEAIDLFVEVLKPLAAACPRPGRAAPDRARAGAAARDHRPVPRGRRAAECPVDRELTTRPASMIKPA